MVPREVRTKIMSQTRFFPIPIAPPVRMRSVFAVSCGSEVVVWTIPSNSMTSPALSTSWELPVVLTRYLAGEVRSEL